MEPIKRIETKWRLFQIHNGNGNMPKQTMANWELVNREVYDSYKDAEDWVLANGDYRTLEYSYIILPCVRVVAEYK